MSEVNLLVKIHMCEYVSDANLLIKNHMCEHLCTSSFCKMM